MYTSKDMKLLIIFLFGFIEETICEVGVYNVAFSKESYQSSTYNTGYSWKAVDNLTGFNYHNGDCTHTDLTPLTWWSVDLGQAQKVVSVNIKTRNCCSDSKRLKYLEVLGSNVSYNFSEVTDSVTCVGQTDLSPGTIKKLPCVNNNVNARFIIIKKQINSGKEDDYPLSLCNVEVLVACDDGDYGDNCSQKCSKTCSRGVVCDKKTGFCSSCMSGYDGTMCNEECPEGKYGSRCHNICSVNCATTCDRFSGSGTCLEKKCKPGYKYGGNCTNECDDRKYGENCVQKCHCKNNVPCNKKTGFCTDGCDIGYIGENCAKTCGHNKYGYDCNSTCPENCRNSLCNQHSLTGECQDGCNKGFTGVICSEIVDSSSTGTIIGVCVGLFLAFGLVAAVLAGVYFISKRRKKSQHGTEESHTFTENNNTTNQPNHDVDMIMKQLIDTPKNTARPLGLDKPVAKVKPGTRTDISEYAGNGDVYANVAKSKTLIGVNVFGEYCAKRKREKDSLKDEYENLPNAVYPWDQAENEKLKPKNRYRNIYPYNNNSVPLQQLGDNELSTYINASFIKDYKGEVSYIAALGVTKSTLIDFWRMIWEHNVSLVVMVTNLVEMGKPKCDRYWPEERQQEEYGDIRVHMEKETVHPSYTIRKLKVTKGTESRNITHYQYTAWPDKTVPENLSSLLKIREVIKANRLQKATPILVHCSAGVGRTGTVIALDILLDQADTEKHVDICVCVETLRTQRTNMVQTLVQYIFLHEALSELFTVGKTLIPSSSIHSVLSSDEGHKRLIKQYETLQSIKPSFKNGDFELGRDEKEKNRDMNILPTDFHRIKFPSTPETYINAVNVEGFKQINAFIATQVPLLNTVNEFWQMVYVYKCTSIVCLQTDPDYTNWFNTRQSNLVFGGYSVTTNAIENSDVMTTYDITVDKYEENDYANLSETNTAREATVQSKLLVVKSWPQAAVDRRDESLIVRLVKELQNQRSDKGKCLVICRNGASECGLYISLSWLFDMLEVEGEVDVYHVVKQIRKTRPQFISSLEHYIFLHKLVDECSRQSSGKKQQYSEDFGDYVNV